MTEQTLFLAALDIDDPAERSAFVAASCGGDETLRRQVEALLAAHDRSGEFLDVPAKEQGEETRAEPTDGGDDSLAFLQPPGRPDSLGRIGHYEVLEVLGRGGFGVVFRAFDEVLQRVVAVKVLAFELAATSPARKRFLREARSSAQVRHENVVQVHATQEQPLPYLVMEFVPGETLQQRLDRTGPLEVADVLRIGREVAEGLAAAHATGLIHRDVKPSNILIDGGPRQQVKLTDFGLARAADDASLTRSGVVAGTPLYMAPEQARGEALDHRADLFSLGSVLYVMLTGRPPFRAETTLAVLKRVAEDDPRPIREVIPEVPEWLCRIVAKLHEKDPAQRYQTAREVADLLADCEAQVKAHGGLKDFRRIPGGRPRRRGRRLRWVAAALGLLLLLGGLAVGVVVVSPAIFKVPSHAGHGTTRKDDPPAVTDADAGDPLTLIARLEGHTAPVKALRFLAGDEKLVSVGSDRTLCQWDLATKKAETTPLADLGSISDADLSPSGSLAAVAYPRGGKTVIWDVANCREVTTIATGSHYTERVIFTPDGRRVLLTGTPGLGLLLDAATGQEVRKFATLDARVTGSGFTSDGRLVGLTVPKEIVIRRVADGQRAGIPLSWSGRPDCCCLATGDEHYAVGHLDGEVIVCFFDRGPANGLPGALLGKQPAGRVRHLQFFDRDRFLLATYDNGLIRIADLQTGKVASQVKGPPGGATEAALSTDGRFLVTAGGETWDDNADRLQATSDYAISLWRLPEEVWSERLNEEAVGEAAETLVDEIDSYLRGTRTTSVSAGTFEGTPSHFGSLFPKAVERVLNDRGIRVAAKADDPGGWHVSLSGTYSVRHDGRESKLDLNWKAGSGGGALSVGVGESLAPWSRAARSLARKLVARARNAGAVTVSVTVFDGTPASFRDALEREIRARGIAVVPADGERPRDQLRVGGRLDDIRRGGDKTPVQILYDWKGGTGGGNGAVPVEGVEPRSPD